MDSANHPHGQYQHQYEAPHFEKDGTADSIRQTVFLMAALCVGLPVLLWAVRLSCLHWRVLPFGFSLLLSDVLELFLIPFMVVAIFIDCERDGLVCTLLKTWFNATRLCGFCLHQLVALEGVVYLRYPACAKNLCSRLSSILLSLTLWACAVTSSTSMVSKMIMTVVLCGLTCIVALSICVLMFKYPPTTAEETPHRDKRAGMTVPSVALASVVCLYGPYIIFLFTGLLNSSKWFDGLFHMSICLVTLRLVADPLLCVFISKEIIKRQPLQTETSHKTDQRSV